MKIEPRYLLQLAAVLECGTFSEAAVKLGTTQPALSRTIAILERRIGAPLFERRRRPLVATEVGRELAGYGRMIMSAAEQAAHRMENVAAGDFGRIRLGAPPFLCNQLLSRMIARFLQDRPGVRITLAPDYVPAALAKIMEDRLDLVICAVALVDRSLDLALEHLIDDNNVIVCRPGHPLLGRASLSPEDMETATWIGHSPDSVLHTDTLDALTSFGVNRVTFPFQSESAGAVVTMLQSTNFLSLLPLSSVRDDVAAGRLAILRFPISIPRRAVGIVHHSKLVLTPAMQSLKAHLRTEFAALNAAQASAA